MLADRERILGHEHPDTLSSRAHLAVAYRDAGRTGEAIELGERVLAARERTLGPEHPHTLSVRAVLAVSYRDAGRTPVASSSRRVRSLNASAPASLNVSTAAPAVSAA